MHYVTTASRFLADYPPLCCATEFSFAPQPTYISWWRDTNTKPLSSGEGVNGRTRLTSQTDREITSGETHFRNKPRESFSYSLLPSLVRDASMRFPARGDVSQDPFEAKERSRGSSPIIFFPSLPSFLPPLSTVPIDAVAHSAPRERVESSSPTRRISSLSIHIGSR